MSLLTVMEFPALKGKGCERGEGCYVFRGDVGWFTIKFCMTGGTLGVGVGWGGGGECVWRGYWGNCNSCVSIAPPCGCDASNSPSPSPIWHLSWLSEFLVSLLEVSKANCPVPNVCGFLMVGDGHWLEIGNYRQERHFLMISEGYYLNNKNRWVLILNPRLEK